MQVAELFIMLGVKGNGMVVKALDGINKGLTSIADSSLAAKAAVVGVVVGMERLTGFASQAGMDLYKFGELTGESTDELQKWQYAMGRFDVSGEEVAGTLSGVKDIMTNMKMGKGAPESMALIADSLDEFDPKRAADDLYYLIGKLQEFAKKAPPSVAKAALKDFGMSGNFVAGFRMMNLEKDKLSKGQIISPAEIQRLVAINKAWKDFWYSLRTMGIKLVAAEGIVGIHMLLNAFKTLSRAGAYVAGLTKKFQVLKVVLMAIGAGIALYFAPLTTVLIALMAVLSAIEENRGKTGKLDVGAKIPGMGISGANGVPGMDTKMGAPTVEGIMTLMGGFFDKMFPSAKDAAVPGGMANANGAPGGASNTQTNVFHITESTSPKQTASDVHSMLLNTPMNAVVGGH